MEEDYRAMDDAAQVKYLQCWSRKKVIKKQIKELKRMIRKDDFNYDRLMAMSQLLAAFIGGYDVIVGKDLRESDT